MTDNKGSMPISSYKRALLVTVITVSFIVSMLLLNDSYNTKRYNIVEIRKAYSELTNSNRVEIDERGLKYIKLINTDCYDFELPVNCDGLYRIQHSETARSHYVHLVKLPAHLYPKKLE